MIGSIPPEPLGRVLTRLRDNAGLSQTELANAVGTSQRQVSRWETGDEVPTDEDLTRLAAPLAHGVTAEAAALAAELQSIRHDPGAGPTSLTSGERLLRNAWAARIALGPLSSDELAFTREILPLYSAEDGSGETD